MRWRIRLVDGTHVDVNQLRPVVGPPRCDMDGLDFMVQEDAGVTWFRARSDTDGPDHPGRAIPSSAVLYVEPIE